ncbi:PIN domain-containing protein [Planctomycetota bacterium]
MNVYVESNFVLEVALRQEQYKSCERILTICQNGKADLVVPAFCLAEPFETLTRRSKDKKELCQKLRTEIEQLSRSEQYKKKNVSEQFQNAVSLLARSADDSWKKLYDYLNQILKIAEIIPLDGKITSHGIKVKEEFDLSPQDSLVYSSVRSHLSNSKLNGSCFVNKNSKDFSNPDITEELESYSCKFFSSFDKASQYIMSQV